MEPHARSFLRACAIWSAGRRQRRDGRRGSLAHRRAARAAAGLSAAVHAAALHARAVGPLGIRGHDTHAAAPLRVVPDQALPTGCNLLAIRRVVPVAAPHDYDARTGHVHVDTVQHRDQERCRDERPL
eukprot:7389202-Prymnesium_polylepis.1